LKITAGNALVFLLLAGFELSCGSDSPAGDNGAKDAGGGVGGAPGLGGTSNAGTGGFYATGGTAPDASSGGTGASGGSGGAPIDNGVDCVDVPDPEILGFNSAANVSVLVAPFVHIRGSSQVRFEAAGIGVVGGSADDAIDSGETLTVDFDDAGAVNVFYTASLGGTAWLQAFDLSDASLGTELVSTSALVEVSQLFGSQPIGRFTITATDPHRVTDLTYSTRPLAAPGIVFAEYPTRIFTTLNWNGLRIEGSLYGGPGLGLGVSGGADSDLIDGNEAIVVTFPYSPVKDVRYTTDVEGTVSLEGFDALGQSLGTQSMSGLGVMNVSDLFADEPLSGFTLRANGGSTRLTEIRAAGCTVR
jgi:hypothetical protein